MLDNKSMQLRFNAQANDIKFNSLEDSGCLTIYLQARNETFNYLLVITFLSYRSYNTTVFNERRSSTRARLSPWLNKVEASHTIISMDRLITVNSEGEPMIAILGKNDGSRSKEAQSARDHG